MCAFSNTWARLPAMWPLVCYKVDLQAGLPQTAFCFVLFFLLFCVLVLWEAAEICSLSALGFLF